MAHRMTDSGSPRRLHVLLGALALVTWLILLTVSLGKREFWTDEVVTAGHIVALENTRDAFHPRGYYLLLYGWKQLFGAGDLSLRAFSLPWAVAAFFLCAAIGRRVLQPQQALLCQWLFVLSPFVVLYFRMARFYSMVTAIALLVAYCALLVVQQGRWRHWLGLGACLAGLLGTSYVAAMATAPLLVWLALIALRRRHGWRLALCVLPGALMVATAVPELVSRATQVSAIEAGAAHGSLPQLAMRVALPAYSLAVGETTDPWRLYITVPAVLAMGGAFVLGLVCRPKEHGGHIVRWAWLGAVAVVAVLLTTVARGEPLSSAARSTIFAAPLAFMLVAQGIGRVRRKALRAALLAVILVTDGYGLMNYYAGRQFLNPAYVAPWRAITAAIEQRQEPTDVVLAYYDTAPERYGSFHNFIYGRPDFFPEKLEPIYRWPQDGFRLWLIARDRGSAEARRLQQELIDKLSPRAQDVQVMDFMPYSAPDRRFREVFLRRKMQDAYVKVYLFIPPDELSPTMLAGG